MPDPLEFTTSRTIVREHYNQPLASPQKMLAQNLASGLKSATDTLMQGQVQEEEAVLSSDQIYTSYIMSCADMGECQCPGDSRLT